MENTPQRRMTVFWQHYLKGGRTIIEYLLELTISQDSSSFIVEIKSLKEKDLHKHVRVKLKNFLTANENSVGQRALIEGELRFGEYELGQTALSLVGTIETKGTKEVVKEETGTEKQDVEIKPEDPVRKSALMTMLKHRASSFRRQSDLHAGGGDIKHLVSSVKALLVDVVEEHFHQPDVIDERRKAHFVETIIPNSPPLTAEESHIIQAVFFPRQKGSRAQLRREEILTNSSGGKVQWNGVASY